MASTDDLNQQMEENCKISNGESSPSSETSEDNADFKLEKLRLHFESCISPEGEVLIDQYILGYDELYKFLNLLGSVFSWVASDVYNKLEIIRAFRKDPEVGTHFNTIESMTSYEIKEDLIKTKAKDCSTGSRNLLRLHRALEYIIKFLDTLPDLEMTDKLCGPSQEAYKATLQKHHPWIVQKAALIAMKMLPTKQGLLTKIVADSEPEQKIAKETLTSAVAAMKDVYKRTDEIYEEKDLLNLP